MKKTCEEIAVIDCGVIPVGTSFYSSSYRYTVIESRVVMSLFVRATTSAVLINVIFADMGRYVQKYQLKGKVSCGSWSIEYCRS